jgi:glycerol-3-phosphate dehydrogenase (NAD(P)+)
VSAIGHIGVVGGGAWGTALACLARRASRRVTLWSRDPSISQAIATKRANPIYLPGVTLEAGIEAARDIAGLARCDALLLVSPAQAVRSLAPSLPGTGPIVICAKGIEAKSGLLMPEVMTELSPSRPLAVLSGPSFAEEAVLGLPTAVSIATIDPHLGRELARAFAADAFRPY